MRYGIMLYGIMLYGIMLYGFTALLLRHALCRICDGVRCDKKNLQPSKLVSK